MLTLPSLNSAVSDLRQHHPAWELAEEFSISETSLKNYFRGVYGQNISVYLREIRMNKAGELLATARLSVAEIAEQVGYLNRVNSPLCSKNSSVYLLWNIAVPGIWKRNDQGIMLPGLLLDPIFLQIDFAIDHLYPVFFKKLRLCPFSTKCKGSCQFSLRIYYAKTRDMLRVRIFVQGISNCS